MMVWIGFIWLNIGTTSGVSCIGNEEWDPIKDGKGNISFSRRCLVSWTPSLPLSVKRFIISCKLAESPLQFFLSSAELHVDQNRNIFLKKFQIYEVDSGRKREIKKVNA